MPANQDIGLPLGEQLFNAAVVPGRFPGDVRNEECHSTSRQPKVFGKSGVQAGIIDVAMHGLNRFYFLQVVNHID